MARPLEYEPDIVLNRAMQVFWRKGFESTSLDDLCDATGLGRSSLYAAFGSKQAMYLRALARYEDAAISRIESALAGPAPIASALREFLTQMIEDIVAGPGRRGCLIGNCAAEAARQNRGVSSRVRRSLGRIEAAFRHGLTRARARGEIAADADVTALARFLTASIQGLRLIGKAQADRATLNDIAQVMLRIVCPPHAGMFAMARAPDPATPFTPSRNRSPEKRNPS